MLILALLFSTLTQFTRDAHPFFFTKTNVEYSKTDKKYQISISIYSDDLEKALIAQGAQALHINTEQENNKTDGLIGHYIQQHLKIMLDGKPLQMKWIGKEKGDEPQVLWCYLEANAPKFKAGQITNTILLEVAETQKNILTFVPASNNSQYLLFQQGNQTQPIKP